MSNNNGQVVMKKKKKKKEVHIFQVRFFISREISLDSGPRFVTRVGESP